MIDSVTPSLKYSVSGSALPFSKGSTARESIRSESPENQNKPMAAATNTRAPIESAGHGKRRATRGAVATTAPNSESRFRCFSSIKRSFAV